MCHSTDKGAGNHSLVPWCSIVSCLVSCRQVLAFKQFSCAHQEEISSGLLGYLFASSAEDMEPQDLPPFTVDLRIFGNSASGRFSGRSRKEIDAELEFNRLRDMFIDPRSNTRRWQDVEPSFDPPSPISDVSCQATTNNSCIAI